MVRVFDVRMAVRPVSHVHFTAPVLSVALHPRLHGTVMLTSPSAVWAMADVGSGAVQQMFEVATDAQPLSAGCLASTGTCAAFASQGGYLHLWANSSTPIVNAHSEPIEVPLSRLPQPSVHLTESSSFALPSFYAALASATSKLASDVDPGTLMEVGLPPRVLKSPVLAPAYAQANGGVYHVRVRGGHTDPCGASQLFQPLTPRLPRIQTSSKAWRPASMRPRWRRCATRAPSRRRQWPTQMRRRRSSKQSAAVRGAQPEACCCPCRISTA